MELGVMELGSAVGENGRLWPPLHMDARRGKSISTVSRHCMPRAIRLNGGAPDRYACLDGITFQGCEILLRCVASRASSAWALAALLLMSPPAALAENAEPVRILAYGDSLVAGYGLPAEEAFPAQLERALEEEGVDAEVIDAGNSGDTTAAAVARLDWVLAENPDAAIVVFGGNDGLRGLDPKETYANLDQVLERLEDEDLPTLLAGMMAPRNLGADYAAEFDAAFPRLADEHDILFYPFFLEGVAARRDLNQPDGIHPNAEGVAVIVEQMLPKAKMLVERARAARPQ
jgi:acyl-CoA thioesterase-1